MRRVLAALLLVACARCGSCKSRTSGDGAAAVDAAAAVPIGSSAPLSLPMAADHDQGGNVYVVGFVAARNAMNLTRFDAQGRLQWNVDVLDALTYSSDAHVDVVGAPDGAVVVWRGLRGGKRVRVARWVAEDGKPAADVFPVGSNACTVGDMLYFIDRTEHVIARPLPNGPDQTVVALAEGGEPTLVCGDGKRALVVEDGEDDVGVRAIESGSAMPRTVIVRADDLGDDEVRSHEDFTTGDVLGDMLLTEKGHLVFRQIGETGVGARRPLDHVLGPDEDLMAVDGNASHVVSLVSREARSRCDADIGTDIVAINLPLPEGKEQVVDVAAGDCGRDLGPYWVAPTSDAIYVAWAVRGPRSGARAPVEALAWAKPGEPAKSVPLSAEDVVFAGCNAGRCAFAVLARPDGTDGMAPGEAQIVKIP